MMQRPLIVGESAVAIRQPKTDRLILGRWLKEAADRKDLDYEGEANIKAAHAILIKWAELESKGRLAKLRETQWQGDFLNEVFGQALGYRRAAENEPHWNLEQHLTIDGQTPDAVLGNFRQDAPREPMAVIELKGPTVHLDRDRANGRTAIDQCWDYLVNLPRTCRWGIVSNLVSFRLYERDSTKRAYEHFSLQSLRDVNVFRKFYVIFHRKGLVDDTAGQRPRTITLFERTVNRQSEVSDELFEAYSFNRTRLIKYLHFELHQPLDDAIETAQRLFDRVMFIAFCEDRHLLPEHSIPKAMKVAGFHDVTNPKWKNFKNLFRFIDTGYQPHGIAKYNGGLFAPHAVDELELPDEPWTTFFDAISSYDFADEVNLDVLGHLFERSITELEKLKTTGTLSNAEKAEAFARMPQSVKRKQLGIYYTPTELTSRIVDYTVNELIDERFQQLAIERGVDPADAGRGVVPDDEAYWRGCLAILQELKIVDPACGSGAFLFQAYNVLEHRYFEVIGHLEKLDSADAGELADRVPHFILQQNLYGVDLSPEAVEITQLALWIRSATEGQTLATLSKNIVHGNSLVHDPADHPAGFDWHERFPEVFARDCPLFSPTDADPPNRVQREKGTVPLPTGTREPGFDCVIGNPPWERIKLQEREFFSIPAPEIATATNAATRRKLVAKLESDDPAIYERYQAALASAESLLTYCRTSNEYPLTGRGDINLYAIFAELAYQLVAPHGRVGILTPSGIASDKTTKDFFAAISATNRLVRLYDFENKKNFFPDVHASFRFCILNFGGAAVSHKSADLVFFIHSVEELEESKRHIRLSGADIKLLNPNTRTCPIFHTRRDADLAKAIYRRIPILIDHNREGSTGNPWGIAFKTMFHQTNDAELFREADTLKKGGFKLKGNHWITRAGASSPPTSRARNRTDSRQAEEVYLPLYEAKMFRPYDHRFGTVYEETSNWINQGQTFESTLVQHQNPEYLVQPRWWVDSNEVQTRLGSHDRTALVGFRDVTRATDSRTFLATSIPLVGATNKVPILLTDQHARRELCLLANCNAFALDYCTRQKSGGISLNFFIVEQLPFLPPDTYDKPCPWAPKTKLEKWISERVLKLTCTAEDMLPLADACDFKSGSFKKEYDGRLNQWDEAERSQIMAELDAAYFLLYGIDRDDAQYILSTFNGIHDPTPLFPNSQSTANRILTLYDEYAAKS